MTHIIGDIICEEDFGSQFVTHKNRLLNTPKNTNIIRFIEPKNKHYIMIENIK